MHHYVKLIYKVTKHFPKDELYGLTSQYRRAGMSVILNYIEGYARRTGDKSKVYHNFLSISYGSLKESKYITYFSFTENYLSQSEYDELIIRADDIGKMLWGILETFGEE
jgi:four helix bundle protein